MTTLSALRVSFALLMLGGAVAADVFVVEQNGPAGVAPINAAIDAAQPGDFVLVKPGDYVSTVLSQVQIDGKGITLVADASVRIELGSVSIRNLPEGETVVLRGFHVEPVEVATLADVGRALAIRDCSGTVWVEDCALVTPGRPVHEFVAGEPGAIVARSGQVTFTACTVAGGAGPDAAPFPQFAPSNLGGAGMSVDTSRVALFDVTMLGGAGGAGQAVGGLGQGGEALVVRGSSDVMLSGSVLRGADADTAPGGVPARPGLRIADAAPTVRRLDTSIDGGLDAGGVPVAAIDNAGGILASYAGTARSLDVPELVRVGTPSSLTITGEPGDLAAVLIGFGGGWLPLPGKSGVLILGAPIFGPDILGVINATGTLTLPFTATMLGIPASLAETYLLQAIVQTAGGQVRVGESTSLLLLGGGF